jgi:Ca2+/Na+ antiporter
MTLIQVLLFLILYYTFANYKDQFLSEEQKKAGQKFSQKESIIVFIATSFHLFLIILSTYIILYFIKFIFKFFGIEI